MTTVRGRPLGPAPHVLPSRDLPPLRSRLRSADLAAPPAGGAAAVLDELAETVQVTLHLVTDDAGLVPDVLHHSMRLDLHLRGDPGVVGVQPVERHHAGLPRPGRGGP